MSLEPDNSHIHYDIVQKSKPQLQCTMPSMTCKGIQKTKSFQPLGLLQGQQVRGAFEKFCTLERYIKVSVVTFN